MLDLFASLLCKHACCVSMFVLEELVFAAVHDVSGGHECMMCVGLVCMMRVHQRCVVGLKLLCVYFLENLGNFISVCSHL